MSYDPVHHALIKLAEPGMLGRIGEALFDADLAEQIIGGLPPEERAKVLAPMVRGALASTAVAGGLGYAMTRKGKDGSTISERASATRDRILAPLVQFTERHPVATKVVPAAVASGYAALLGSKYRWLQQAKKGAG